MPLVDHSHNILGLELVKVPEDPDVPHVDEDLLLQGRALVEEPDQEVDPAPVHGLCEGLSAPDVKHVSEILRLAGPSRGSVEGGHECLPDEGVRVKIGLQSQGLDGGGIEFNSAEDGLRVVLRRVPEGVGGFESGGEEGEVFGEA